MKSKSFEYKRWILQNELNWRHGDQEAIDRKVDLIGMVLPPCVLHLIVSYDDLSSSTVQLTK